MGVYVQRIIGGGTTMTTYSDYTKEIAQAVYDFAEEQRERGNLNTTAYEDFDDVEIPFGQGGVLYLTGIVSATISAIYEEGDRYTPAYLDEWVSGVKLFDATVYDDYTENANEWSVKLDRETLKAINNELVKLCA